MYGYLILDSKKRIAGFAASVRIACSKIETLEVETDDTYTYALFRLW